MHGRSEHSCSGVAKHRWPIAALWRWSVYWIPHASMSRHAYGPSLHHAHMRPTFAGNLAGEEFPKRVPPGGCGFAGVPGDVPPERLRWYTKEGKAPCAGPRSSTLRDSRGMGSSASVPSLGMTQEHSPMDISARVSGGSGRTGSPEPKLTSQLEVSHAGLHYGRSQRPETLRHAGVSTFDQRRYYMTRNHSPQL